MEEENMLKDMEQRLSYQGLKLEQYLQMMGKTAEDMKKEYEPQAIEAIKSRLVLEAVMFAVSTLSLKSSIIQQLPSDSFAIA